MDSPSDASRDVKVQLEDFETIRPIWDPFEHGRNRIVLFILDVRYHYNMLCIYLTVQYRIAGGAPDGWKTSYVLVLLLLGVVLCGTFVG